MNTQLKERLKRDKNILEKVLEYYGANRRNKGNWDCIPQRHKNPKQNLSIKFINGVWVCACHCGLQGDVFKVVEILEGITNFTEQIEKVCEISGVKMEYESTYKTNTQQKQESKSYDFTSLITELHTNVDQTDYFIKNRGFSKEIIERYKLGYCSRGYNAALQYYKELQFNLSNIVAYQYFIPILDTDNKCKYFISRRNDDISKDNSKTLNLRGLNIRFFNDRYIYDPTISDKFIFLVEGWADALSIEEIGFNSIALNSTSNANNLLKLIEANKDKLKTKVFVVVGDEDTAGKQMIKTLFQGLEKLKLNTEVFENMQYKDFNEWLVADRVGFKNSIELFICNIANEFSELNYLSNSFIAQIEENEKKKAIRTGLTTLDKYLGGGLYDREMTVIAGESSLGKTTLVLNICNNIAIVGKPVLFFSLEQSRFELVSKSLTRIIFRNSIAEKYGYKYFQDREIEDFICNLDLNTRKVMLNRVDRKILLESIDEYKSVAKNLKIIEGNFNTNAIQIKEKLEEYISFTGERPVVIVDYLQILKSIDNKTTEIKKIADDNIYCLKQIARDMDVHLIVISSVNRSSYGTRLTFNSLKESGNIEYTADNVFTLSLLGMDKIGNTGCSPEKNEEYMKLKKAPIRKVELEILKQRNGEIGQTVGLRYIPKMNDYSELYEIMNNGIVEVESNLKKLIKGDVRK